MEVFGGKDVPLVRCLAATAAVALVARGLIWGGTGPLTVSSRTGTHCVEATMQNNAMVRSLVRGESFVSGMR